jgi:serine/threonine protein kinase
MIDIGLKPSCDIVVLEKIGQGGFGQVFRVQTAGVEYALKQYKSTDITLDQVIELLISRYLLNEFTLRPLAVLHDDVCLSELAMATLLPIAVSDVADLIIDQRLVNSGLFMRQMCQALDYIHRCNVIHADIKPANILVMSDGSFKLSDFGLSIIVPYGDNVVSKIRGTRQYMYPPNFVPDQPLYTYNANGDIYAFGLTLYQIMSKSLSTTIKPSEIEDPFWTRLIVTMTSLDPKRILSIDNIQSYLTNVLVVAEIPQPPPYEVEIPLPFIHETDKQVSLILLHQLDLFLSVININVATLLHWWDIYFLFLPEILSEDVTTQTIFLNGITITGVEVFHTLMLTAAFFTSDQTLPYIKSYCHLANPSLLLRWIKTYDDTLFRPCLSEITTNYADLANLCYELWKRSKTPECRYWYEIHRLDLAPAGSGFSDEKVEPYSITYDRINRNINHIGKSHRQIT